VTASGSDQGEPLPEMPPAPPPPPPRRAQSVDLATGGEEYVCMSVLLVDDVGADGNHERAVLCLSDHDLTRLSLEPACISDQPKAAREPAACPPSMPMAPPLPPVETAALEKMATTAKICHLGLPDGLPSFTHEPAIPIARLAIHVLDDGYAVFALSPADSSDGAQLPSAL